MKNQYSLSNQENLLHDESTKLPNLDLSVEDSTVIHSSQLSTTFTLSPSLDKDLKKRTNFSLQRQISNSEFKIQFQTQSPLNLSSSQVVRGPSPDTTYGFKYKDGNLTSVKAIHEYEFLTSMCLECHVRTRPNLLPDPVLDEISAVFFSITQDVPADFHTPQTLKGAILVNDDMSLRHHHCGISSLTCLYVDSEEQLFEEVVSLVHNWDPDILVGYEVQMLSWGYLLERGAIIKLNIVARLSRVPEDSGSHFDQEKDEYGTEHTHHLHITGRIILNVWRLMRAEVPLLSYSIENVAFHVLHIRIPQFSYNKLYSWWTTEKERWRVIEHYVQRCCITMQLLNQLNLISRTSELARLFGIPFYDVLSRGSQFRVESMMLRLSRCENMVAISPSAQQRSKMRAPEWIPLVMEPESMLYIDPVVVLDFQSLYPTMMIAYNYCYSTCLGRVSTLGEDAEPFVFGTSYLQVSPEYLSSIIDQINISPCGVAFVQPCIKKGVLPKMLEEILNTRIMVKTAMKKHANDSSLGKVLHSRQLGLKLIANVTYGYTSANFSGRMPCTEVGDSVVSKGRETLERAISLVNSNPDWKAKVVYGDTDSLFVHLPGRSKEEAFKLGKEMADEITKVNPKPVKLKFEKVYLPCILQTKKRYVGYMYEFPEQKEPIFDAKGIETVRRDGCPAVSKVLEKSLKLLFDTKDISLVKNFVQRQFNKIILGKASIHDLIYAKEFRGLRGYRPSSCVPALELTRQWMKIDRRKEPRVGERVPYVIVYGAPGLPLIKLVRSPENVLSDASLRINAHYYVSKAIIPPLNRCFTLLGIDVNKWYLELPRTNNASNYYCSSNQKGHSITSYFASGTCPSCGGAIDGRLMVSKNYANPLCSLCQSQPQKTVLNLASKIRQYERALDHIKKVCEGCIGYRLRDVDCISLDCPITFRLNQASRKNEESRRLQEILDKMN